MKGEFNLPCVSCGKKYGLHSPDEFFSCFLAKLDEIQKVNSGRQT